MDDFGKLAAIAGSTSAEIGFSMTRFDPGPQAVNPAVVITNKKLKRKSVTGIVIASVAQRGKSQASQKNARPGAPTIFELQRIQECNEVVLLGG
jgi:hypothetical protein